MNRRIVYTAQIPLSADFLQAQKDALQALCQLAHDVMAGSGTPALLAGLACSPTDPASMTVNFGPGSVYQRGALDGAAFGSLPADPTVVLQQGYSTTTQNLGGLVAPATAGQSIDYLVQVQFRQVDERPLILPYYNSANPQVPLVGPGGDGTPQSTDRTGALAVQVLAGPAAPSGSQTTPAVVAGWIPAYVITVAYGQTTLGSGNIAVHAQAPFLASLTSRHHLGLPGTAPKIDLAREVEGNLPGGIGFAFGQGLKAATDGTIVPDYDGTGTAARPARSDHTHANGAGIGGPYQAQGSYAAASHTHGASAITGGVPWAWASGSPPAGDVMIKTGESQAVTLNASSGVGTIDGLLNWADMGFTALPIILLTVYTWPQNQQIATDYQAFQVGWCPSRTNPNAVNCTIVGAGGIERQVKVNWLAIGTRAAS